jgi:hypothetical protein
MGRNVMTVDGVLMTRTMLGHQHREHLMTNTHTHRTCAR